MTENQEDNIDIDDIKEDEVLSDEQEEALCDDKADDSEKESLKDKKDVMIEELTDRYKRLLAEFDNYRKRTEKEKSSMYEMGAKDTLEKVLPVVDNFERGLATVTDEQAEDAFVVGMSKTFKQLETVLEGLGVTPIDTKDKEFDPNLHNAVMHVDDEELGDNTIVEEFQKGYMYKESVLRHSMVKVAN